MATRTSGAEPADVDFKACDGGYRAIVQHSPDLIVRYDRHLRICYVNSAVTVASGTSREHWLGRTTGEVGIPGCRWAGSQPGPMPEWEDALQSVVETGREFHLDHEVETARGPRWFCTRFLSQRSVDGSVASVVSISRDITRRVRDERALRERERVLGAALDAAEVGVVVLAPDGAVSEWSAAQERLTGVPRAEALGRTIWDIQSALLPAQSRGPENVEQVRAGFASLLSGASGTFSPWSVPFMVERPDGTRRLIEMTAVGGSGAGGQGVMLVTRQVEPRPRTDRPGGEHGPA